MKRIVCIFASALLFFVLCLAVSAENVTSFVTDECDVLADTETAELATLMRELEDRTGYTFRLYVYEERQSAFYGEDYLRKYGFRESDDLLLLIVTRYQGTWYYDLYTYGSCDEQLSDSELDDLLDAPDVYGNIKNGAIYAGTYHLFLLSESLLTNGEQRGDVLLSQRIGRALIIAFFITLITGGAIIFSYKRKSRSTSYPLDEFTTLDLTRREDTFLDSHVTSVYSPKSSSNSSGGGGGGRGGGSGHRGGR